MIESRNNEKRNEQRRKENSEEVVGDQFEWNLSRTKLSLDVEESCWLFLILISWYKRLIFDISVKFDIGQMDFKNSDELRILDGGSGYEAIDLCSEKLSISQHKCWSAKLLYDDQDMVRKIHRRFLAAGAEVVTSLSYQASLTNLTSSFNISIDEARQLMMDSVQLVKDEIRSFGRSTRSILSAASIGPYGASLADGSEYTGSYIDQEPLAKIMDYYRHQIDILARAEPDLLAFETIPSLAELEMIVELMREHPNMPAWISMNSCDGLQTAHGEPLGKAVDFVNERSGENIFAFGTNCIIPLKSVRRTVREIRAKLHPSKIVLVYPNSGEMWDRSSDQWQYPDGIDDNTFYDELPLWIEEGARWIGGCCRMGSSRMEKVSQIIASHRHKMQDC